MNLNQLTPAELAGYAYLLPTKTPLEEALLRALQALLDDGK